MSLQLQSSAVLTLKEIAAYSYLRSSIVCQDTLHLPHFSSVIGLRAIIILRRASMRGDYFRGIPLALGFLNQFGDSFSHPKTRE